MNLTRFWKPIVLACILSIVGYFFVFTGGGTTHAATRTISIDQVASYDGPCTPGVYSLQGPNSNPKTEKNAIGFMVITCYDHYITEYVQVKQGWLVQNSGDVDKWSQTYTRELSYSRNPLDPPNDSMAIEEESSQHDYVLDDEVNGEGYINCEGDFFCIYNLAP